MKEMSFEKMERIEGKNGWGCAWNVFQMGITIGVAAGAGAVTGGWAALGFLSSFSSAGIGIAVECGEVLADL